MTSPGHPIKVVFLTFYFEAWDALADIHSLMLADERFKVTVISIPRRFRADEPFAQEERVSEFLDASGVEHLRFNFEDSMEGLAKLRDLAPDYVFINYPWQRNYQPGYRVEQLAEFTKVAYVPYYSLALANEPGEDGVTPYLYTQRSNQLASLVFTQDPNTLDAYAKTSRGNGYVHLTGTPKIDALVRKVQNGETHWPLPDGNRKLVWAPHHSFSEDWFNFGMFPEIAHDMLQFAKSHPDLDIVLRPHPIMFGNLVASGMRTKPALDSWITDWNSLPNTAIDSEGDIGPLFAAADIFVSDGISFLGEYPLATGKPAVFFEKQGHWPWSPIGKIASRANLHVHNFVEFEEVFEDFLEHGLPDFSSEIGELRTAAQPFPGEAAAKIVEVILQDFESHTPLVDIAAITEVAWENRPGTEPSWD
jgi:CDP-glycerol glycerophosphotransferase (TagB/SpsB family)